MTTTTKQAKNQKPIANSQKKDIKSEDSQRKFTYILNTVSANKINNQ